MTADTFVQDWGIACAKDTASEVSYILQPIVGFDACAKLNKQVLESASGDQPDHASGDADHPVRRFPRHAWSPRLLVGLPAPAGADVRRGEGVLEVPVGAGPYQFVSFVPNKSIVIKKSPGYFGTPAHINEVSFQIYPSSNEEAPFQAFKSGQEDYARIRPVRSRPLRPTPTIGKDVQTGTELSLYYYGFQLNGNNELAHNKTLRQALAWGTNSPAIVNNINEGIGSVADGLVPPGIPGFKKGMSPYHYDPNKAQQLVKSSGDANPSIELSYNTDPGNQRIAEALAQGYEQSGHQGQDLELRLGHVPGQAVQGQLEFWRLGWLADYPLMDNFLFPLFDEAGRDLQ